MQSLCMPVSCNTVQRQSRHARNVRLREEAELGQERSRELSRLTDSFILRRTKALNAAYLPPLASYVVFCRPSPLQARACSCRQGTAATVAPRCVT